MYINKIILNNFRNYSYQEINLEKGINVFYGDNGEGKTNILEAIFMCALGKSFRTSNEKEVIKLSKQEAIIDIEYQKKDRTGKIKCDISDKKIFLLNDIKVKRLSEILGNMHIVLFSPDDIEILKKGPQNRRKFLNMMISQIRPKYIYILNQYLKVLEQRNTYLRQIKFENKNEDLLNIWDEKLAEYGYQIYEYRNTYINKLKEKINKFHSKITDDKEKIKIEYKSDCSNKSDFLKKLDEMKKIDIAKGHTTKGVHRDDFILSINDKEISAYGSQGQHRTAILSLKLSELDVIYDEIDEYPILLLDDFMSELDEKRRKNLLENISNNQVLITCTDKLVINNISKIFEVKNGTTKEI